MVTAQVFRRCSGRAEARYQGFGVQHESLDDVPALFLGGRDEAADDGEVVRPLFRAEAAGDFLTVLHQVPVRFPVRGLAQAACPAPPAK